MCELKLAGAISEALDALRHADKELTALYIAIANGNAESGERFAAGSAGVQRVRAAIQTLEEC